MCVCVCVRACVRVCVVCMVCMGVRRCVVWIIRYVDEIGCVSVWDVCM